MRALQFSLLILPFVVACGGAQAAPPATANAASAPNAAPASAAQSAPPPSIAVTAEMGSPHPGDPAPEIEGLDQSGNTVKLSAMKGSVVVLAFVTSWCPFSAAEQPHLAQLGRDYAGKNVKVLAVALKENAANYKKYMDRVAMPFPVLHDEDGALAKLYTPVNAQPNVKDRASVIVTSNLVIDPQGTIQFFTLVDTAHFDAELINVRHEVDALLAKAGGS
ncbi:MAG TPA: peroxiredoxin family protein [Polyangiaceae bacterium]|nr:peroxiredoxin family protein [Polyangiaceae bacterium]